MTNIYIKYYFQTSDFDYVIPSHHQDRECQSPCPCQCLWKVSLLCQLWKVSSLCQLWCQSEKKSIELNTNSFSLSNGFVIAQTLQWVLQQKFHMTNKCTKNMFSNIKYNIIPSYHHQGVESLLSFSFLDQDLFLLFLLWGGPLH